MNPWRADVVGVGMLDIVSSTLILVKPVIIDAKNYPACCVFISVLRNIQVTTEHGLILRPQSISYILITYFLNTRTYILE